ncbi:lipopolysaccharide kinase InaA family protein, partial [Psychroserpens sp.]
MQLIKKISKPYVAFESQLDVFIADFNTQGTPFGDQDRNSLKLFSLNGKTVNIKSFRIPNLVNKIAYRFFRKSKAQRSFEYAHKLLELKIGTPQPIAYYAFNTSLAFNKSYYISEQLDCDLTFRELTREHDYPNHETILRAFTRFTFELHEKGVYFLDHSPGNTLIKEIDGAYHFYLVDLNRMEFKPMDFDARMKNFERLTPHKSIVETMSDEYAKLYDAPKDKIFDAIWTNTKTFQER